jgi:hypothetical protein
MLDHMFVSQGLCTAKWKMPSEKMVSSMGLVARSWERVQKSLDAYCSDTVFIAGEQADLHSLATQDP